MILLSGCGPTIRPSFDSPEPAARNAAIVEAARKSDQSTVPDLVRMLDSDDPATRQLAIQTLEQLTGQRLGYDPTDTLTMREAAISRWRAYVNDHRPRNGPATASGER